nr:MAG TPA: hypothetical protein [Caudoviricetes sp.]
MLCSTTITYIRSYAKLHITLSFRIITYCGIFLTIKIKAEGEAFSNRARNRCFHFCNIGSTFHLYHFFPAHID